MNRNRWVGLVLCLVIVLSVWYVLSPALDLGFVSDDFVHLSADQGKSWYFSSDPLHRPLRNGLFKLLGESFGLSPEPYRVLAFSAYFVCALLFFVFLRRLGIAVIPSAAAALLAFFSPRNHALLFWFAAEQDVLYAICILGMLICWISFRQQGKTIGWIASIVLYGCALGFKETAIVAPALVALTDWFIAWRPGVRKSDINNWLPYLAFVIPVIGFGWFVYWYPASSKLADPGVSHSTYGMGGALGAVLAEARSILNLIVPFVPSFALRDIGTSMAIKIAVVIAFLTVLVVFSPAKKIWIFAALWMLVALLPTSIFARSINSEYYLFLAGFGLAVAIASSLNDIAERSRGFVGPVFVAALLLYCLEGARLLQQNRKQWAEAAAAVHRIIEATEQALPTDVASHLDVINVPHTVDGKPALANGLDGALIAGGYSRSMVLRVNHDSAVPPDQERQMIDAVRMCPMTEPRNDYRILLASNYKIEDHTGPCARNVVAEDIRRRPWAWIADSGNAPER
jgi:hypothetical protein